jgi:RNA polymerase sigma-70 factor (ECF subfamily)
MEAFTAGLPPGVGAPAGDLEAVLGAFHEAGRAAWPTIEVDPSALCRWLAARAAPPAATLPDPALAGDAYLACACAEDAPGALCAFDRAFGPMIGRVLARVDASPSFVEDAAQAVLEKLFAAPPGAQAKIAEYAGRAPLRVWLRAVTVRTALNLRRGRAPAPHDAVDADDERLLAGAGVDPEIRLAKARFKAELEDAVRAAVARLSSRERTLLRLHLVDGLSIDVLGAHHRVGRSTAARWLAAAREALREHTRAELAARLGPVDLASVAAFVRSQLELSARGLLADPALPA